MKFEGYECKSCRCKVPTWRGYCPSCNQQGVIVPIGYHDITPKQETPLWIKASEIKEETVLRIPSGLPSVDEVFGGGLAIPSVILMGGNPGIGKCLAGSTLVITESGEAVPLSASPLDPVLSYQAWNGKNRAHAVEAWIPSPEKKQTFKLTSSTGRAIEATAEHPFLTPSGYRPLSQLRPGDAVAIARRTNVFGDVDGSKVAYALGHFAASLQQKRFRTDAIEAMVKDSVDLKEYIGQDGPDLSKLFRWNEDSLCLFFKSFFSSATLTVSKSTRTFRIRHTSDRHLRQICSLLLRFGLVTKLAKEGKYWCFTVADAATLREIALVFSPENQLFFDQAVNSSAGYDTRKDLMYLSHQDWQGFFDRTKLGPFRLAKEHGINIYGHDFFARGKIRDVAEIFSDEPLLALCNAEVFWDRVATITDAGFQTVYDLSIPDTENFIANDFIVHNSTLLLGIVGSNAKESLYITSEEPAPSIGLRAQRLGLKNVEDIRITSTISIEKASNAIKNSRAKIVIMDSLQGLRNISQKAEEDFLKAKAEGKITKQFKHTLNSVRDMALDLIQLAMKHHVAMVLVNHMNKGGDLSGVKEIEHMVDVASFFTGDPNGFIRELRCRKNRYGGTAGKVAKLLMTNRGILEASEENMELYAIKEPSKASASDRKAPKSPRRPIQNPGSEEPLWGKEDKW